MRGISLLSINDSEPRRRYLMKTPNFGESSVSKGGMADKIKNDNPSPALKNGSGGASRSGGSNTPISTGVGGGGKKESGDSKGAVSKGVDKGLEQIKKRGKGTPLGEGANLASKIKNASQTAKKEGAAAAAADVAAAGARTALAATGVGKAANVAMDAAKKLGKAVGVNIKDRYFLYAAIFLSTWQFLLVLFVIMIAASIFGSPSKLLKAGWSIAKHYVGLSVSTQIDQGVASRMAYELPVGKDGQALAAPTNYNPATMPKEGTLEYKLANVDWEKAKFQSVTPDVNCDIKTSKVVGPNGKERSVIDTVTIKGQTDNLQGIARSNCIDKTYPLFNTIMRSEYIRENLNKKLGIRYAYAAPRDSGEIRGKSDAEIRETLRNKTLSRVWQSSGKGVEGVKPINDNNTPRALNTNADKYLYPTDTILQPNVANCANNYEFPAKPSWDNAIAKARHDLICGVPPDQIIFYARIPKESEAESNDPAKKARAQAAVLNTICQIYKRYGTDTNDTASENYKKAVKDRIKSEANAAFSIITYDDTAKTYFPDIKEWSADSYKVLGLGKAQQYSFSVNGRLAGETISPDGLSKIFGGPNIKGSTFETRDGRKVYLSGIYNDAQSARINEAFATIAQENCSGSDAIDWDDLANGVVDGVDIGVNQARSYLDSFYRSIYTVFKLNVSNLDSYKRTKDGSILGQEAAKNKVKIENVMKSLILTASNNGTSGVEDGPANFNRQSIGSLAYKNSLIIAMGGQFFNQNEAIAAENLSNSIIAYEDQSKGLIGRLFDKNNPRSVFSRLQVAFTDYPQNIPANVASLVGNLFNPARNLIGGRDSLAYTLTGKSNVAQAATSHEINNLHIDPAGFPPGFYEVPVIENGRTIEKLIEKNQGAALLMYQWELCMREFMPDRFHLHNPDASNEQQKNLYNNFCKELYDTQAPGSNGAPKRLSNVSVIQRFFDNPNSINLSVNSQDRRDLSFMFRVYHFNMLQAEALEYLSDPSKEDTSLNAEGSAGESGEDTHDPQITATPTGDRNAPCPAGTTDAGTGTRYGVGRVFQYSMRLCKVNNTVVSVTMAANLLNLFNAAAADGITLGGGGYRSFDQQVAVRRKNGCPDLYTAPSSSCRPPTAIPGKSMHEAGEAVDFTQGGSTLSRSSSGFLWMKYNAGRFGFKNLPSEPWHWSSNGG